MNYTNEASLKATFGDAEVTGLLQDAPGTQDSARLEKAAATAADEINGWLRSSGYLLPLVFSEYGADLQPEDPPYLAPMLQTLSDHFTAFHLASSADLNKKKYEELRAAGLELLSTIHSRKFKLDLPLTTEITGGGQVVTIARPRVFDRIALVNNGN